MASDSNTANTANPASASVNIPDEKFETRFVQCYTAEEGIHNIAYHVYGPQDASSEVETVLCVHGLTRNRWDFHFLASALSQVSVSVSGQHKYRVVVVDMPGRGDSDWFGAANKKLYSQPVEQGITYIGTSMGGLIGMMVAGLAKTPIKRLVINDIGPFLPKESLQRIASYVGADPSFSSVEEAEQNFFVKFYGPLYGPTVSHPHFDFLARHGVAIRESDGKYHLRYDPDIKVAFSDPEVLKHDVSMWPMWDKVNCPVLLLHGELSDVLPLAVANKMAEKKQVQLITYPSTGHIPPLMSDLDIGDIVKWMNNLFASRMTLTKLMGQYTSAVMLPHVSKPASSSVDEDAN